MSSSNKKLTKRQQKALAFQKNRRQKFKKQVTDNNNGGENDLIEEQLVGNEIVNPEKSIKRKHIKEVGELKEIEKEKYKNKKFKNHKEGQDSDEDVDENTDIDGNTDVNGNIQNVEEIKCLDKKTEPSFIGKQLDNNEQLDSDQNESEDIEDKTTQDNPEKSGSNNIKLKKTPTRFIIFVANLPYNTKSEELSKHFESAGVPISIRLITDKVTKKQKGFAFIEFDNSQSMKKALIFQHTIFKNRQIRVELTAGGGGNKSEIRRKKLEEKKKKLKDERRKFHETYIVPIKSKSSEAVDHSESTFMLKPISQPDNKTQTKIKKPRKLKGSNAIKLNNTRTFG